MIRLAHLFSAILITATAWSQTTPKTWQSESFRNLRTNDQGAYTCLFKVYPGERIEWIQGTDVQTFEITSSEGVLPEDGDGAVTYHIDKEGNYGNVVVERSGQEMFLTIDLTKDIALGAHYRFKLVNP